MHPEPSSISPPSSATSSATTTSEAMSMTMSEDYYAGDLDDVVHRLLPREIWADVGIVVAGGGAPPSSCAVTRSDDEHAAAVVEKLSAHLVHILGLDGAREQQRASRPHLQHPRAGMGCGSRAPAGGGHGAAVRYAPDASGWNGTAPRMARLEMVAAAHSHPPARFHGTGTGVFLPRVEAYVQNRASSTSPSPRNGAKPPRAQRREAAVVVAMRQRQRQRQRLQLLHLRAMAAEMQRQREAFAAAFHGCPAIALPQQWTY